MEASGSFGPYWLGCGRERVWLCGPDILSIDINATDLPDFIAAVNHILESLGSNARVVERGCCRDCRLWSRVLRGSSFGVCVYSLNLLHEDDYCSDFEPKPVEDGPWVQG